MQLIGKHVSIVVSEPWDVVTEMTSPCLKGVVAKASLSALVITLDVPLSSRRGTYRWLLACPRHAGDSFEGVSASLFCNLDSMTQLQVDEGMPDTASFVGELGLMGDVAW